MRRALSPSMGVATVAKRLVKSLGVGGLSSLADLLVLTFLVEAVRLQPLQANVPALLAGALVQFVGCRLLVFRSTSARVVPQLAAFTAVELATLALNALAFTVLVKALPYGAARIVGSFSIYLAFSYPCWHVVFRGPQEEP